MKTNTTVNSIAAYTLKEAVLDAVSTLKSNGTFSVHDVTAQIRKSVNDGEYILPGLEAAAGSAFKYNVNHDSIKEVIDSLLNDGTLANLGLSNVNYDGAYRTFEFSNQAVVDNDSDDETNEVADATVSESPVAKRVKAYLEKVGTATLKQVQSMLKTNGVTCKDLATTLDELGFTVTEGTPGCYSTYTVEE